MIAGDDLETNIMPSNSEQLRQRIHRGVTQQRTLFSRIKSVKDIDDDEFKAMKKRIAKHQMNSGNVMCMVQTVVLLILFLSIISIYAWLLIRSPSSLSSSSTSSLRIVTETNKGSSGIVNIESLKKSLGILRKSLGIFIFGRRRPEMPTPIRFVTITSKENSEVIHDLSYRKLFWRPASSASENESEYLVPTTRRYEPVRNFLHRTMRLRSKGMDMSLLHVHKMRTFLEGKSGEECCVDTTTTGYIGSGGGTVDSGRPDDLAGSNDKSLLDQFDSMGERGLVEAQKHLWIWCMLYTGEVHGFIDLDTFDIDLKKEFIYDMSSAIKEQQHAKEENRVTQLNSNSAENSTIHYAAIWGVVGRDILTSSTTNANNSIDEEVNSNSSLLSASFLFVSRKYSSVAREMIQYLRHHFHDENIDHNDDYGVQINTQFQRLIHAKEKRRNKYGDEVEEQEQWDQLSMDCNEEKNLDYPGTRQRLGDIYSRPPKSFSGRSAPNLEEQVCCHLVFDGDL